MNFTISGRVARVLLSASLVWAASGEAMAATPAPVLELVQALPLSPKLSQAKPLEVGGAFYCTSMNGGAWGGGSLYKVTREGAVTILVNFTGTNGSWPMGALIQGPDGALYGTTQSGGAVGNYGTVFRATLDGQLTTLASFSGSNGSGPTGALVLGADGNFYGTTATGGASSKGSVFRITPGGTLTSLASFNGTNGSKPAGSLVADGNGLFHGVCSSGGSNNAGTFFTVTTEGVITRMADFSAATGNTPAGIIPDGGGNFLGVAGSGGAFDKGTVFRITPAGTITPLASFTTTASYQPSGELAVAGNGNIYGTTYYGGSGSGSTYGTVFRLTPEGALTTLVTFDITNGAFPAGGLTLGSDGLLYGVTREGGIAPGFHGAQNGVFFRVDPQGPFTALSVFTDAMGRSPLGGLACGADGNLYGATSAGGPSGYGAFFRMTPQGGLNVVQGCSNSTGLYPKAQLAVGTGAASGSVFGSTTFGGPGDGAIVEINTATQATSIYQELHSPFTVPVGTQSVGKVLNLGDKTYGMTSVGGTNGKGAFLRMESGTIRVEGGRAIALTNFSSSTGNTPLGGPTWAGGSTFYATTSAGGTGGKGTIFKIDGETGVLATLVNFNGTNGGVPMGELLLAGDAITGTFYGTTSAGGASNLGTVFKMTPDGTFTTLASFTGTAGATPGSTPRAGLTLGPDGNLYGTTQKGGSYDDGTVYQVTPEGVLTTLVNFDGMNGAAPWCALTAGADGNLYGITSAGGLAADGVSGGGGQIFRLHFQPQVATQVADPVSHIDALLHGTVTPVEQGSTFSFEWGTDSALATSTTLTAQISGGSGGSFSAVLGNLAPLTTYYYRGVTTLADGVTTVRGDIQSFTTLPAPPDIAVEGPGHAELVSGGPAIVLENTRYLDTREITFTLRNTSAGSTLSGITATFADPDGAFGISRQPTETLGFGSTTTVVVRFTPMAVGGFTGVLTIASDDPDEPAFTIPLRGWGGLLFDPVIDPANPAPVVWDGFTATGITLFGIVLEGPPHRGTEYVILDNPGSAAIAGTFTGLPEGSLVTLTYGGNNYRFLISYEGGDGNDIVLSYWPETGIDPADSPEAFLFAALDSDRDDKLTLTEWQGIYAKIPKKEAIFTAIDTSKDGFLSYAEFTAGATNRTASRTITTAVNRTAVFMEVDTSYDNIVSRAEIAFMWKPGTAAKTIDAYWTRAKGGDGMDFWEWLWAQMLPSFTTYGQASTLRVQRLAIATQLDTDTSGTITFAEFSHLYKAGTKTTTIDTAWRAANATPRGIASPAEMTINAFVEAAKLPKLTVF